MTFLIDIMHRANVNQKEKLAGIVIAIVVYRLYDAFMVSTCLIDSHLTIKYTQIYFVAFVIRFTWAIVHVGSVMPVITNTVKVKCHSVLSYLVMARCNRHQRYFRLTLLEHRNEQ